MTKLLIDECLSAELTLMARERGHHNSSHVVWIGKAGWKDWELKQILLDEDWVLFTWNCKDFRGPKAAPGTKGILKNVPVHAGLICIEGPTGMDLNIQKSFFDAVLTELEQRPDMTNQVLEVSFSVTGDEIKILECPVFSVLVLMRETGFKRSLGWHEGRSIRLSRL
jgi:hypothetical protein